MTILKVSCSSRAVLLFMTVVAALQIDDAVSSNTIPAFPQNRFVPWSNLDWVTRDYADYLSYTEDTWNNLLTASLEQMPYTEVEQSLGLYSLQFGSGRSAAGLHHIAVDDETWDCWINHYVGNTWEDLRDVHDVSWAFEALGWSESTWQSENQGDWPPTELKMYDQLTDEETKAADRICCPAEVWDGTALTEWEYNDDGVSAAQLRFEGKYTPTDTPTEQPFTNPTDSPMTSPINNPTIFLEGDLEETEAPTEYVRKTDSPSASPSGVPTNIPSTPPSFVPSYAPSEGPSGSFHPSVAPSDSPSKSASPSAAPSSSPSAAPSDGPSSKPSSKPSGEPSLRPTTTPSEEPSGSFYPSTSPSERPSKSVNPSSSPSVAPSAPPSDGPSSEPSSKPSAEPSLRPTTTPSEEPSGSFYPSTSPSERPSRSLHPSSSPSAVPSAKPSAAPSAAPSDGPSDAPSDGPSVEPSIAPTVSPSSEPSSKPTAFGCRATFTLVLLTDKYPVETTWTLTMLPSNNVIGEGSKYKNDFETHEENVCLRYDSCYMFEIRDKWDDGICCGNGQGSYAGFLQYEGTTAEQLPIPGVSGGAFESSERHKFCLDENGDLVEGLGNAIGVRFNGEE